MLDGEMEHSRCNVGDGPIGSISKAQPTAPGYLAKLPCLLLRIKVKLRLGGRGKGESGKGDTSVLFTRTVPCVPCLLALPSPVA